MRNRREQLPRKEGRGGGAAEVQTLLGMVPWGGCNGSVWSGGMLSTPGGCCTSLGMLRAPDNTFTEELRSSEQAGARCWFPGPGCRVQRCWVGWGQGQTAGTGTTGAGSTRWHSQGPGWCAGGAVFPPLSGNFSL